jgi:hypothetical protein
MKSILSRIAIALVITSLTTGMALGLGRKESVTFDTNIKVNGTPVSKGVYDLKYDEKTEELSIVKGKKVIAKVTTTAGKRDGKARRLELRSTGTGDDKELISVTFGGMDHDLIINNSQASR